MDGVVKVWQEEAWALDRKRSSRKRRLDKYNTCFPLGRYLLIRKKEKEETHLLHRSILMPIHSFLHLEQ